MRDAVIPPSTAARRDANVLGRLRTARLMALVVPLVVTVAAAVVTYRDTFTAATTRADRAARIAEEHALRLFDTNQMLLLRMLDLVGHRRDAELRADGAELSARLAGMATDLPQVQGLFINGADARPVANSRVYPVSPDLDYSDREWFRVHREGRGPAVFVTEQLTSKITGEPFFDMSRRRTDDQHQFAGTVSVSLRPEYLMQFYARLGEAEPGLRITLYRDDGRLVAGWPRVAGATGIPPGHPLAAAFHAHVAEGRFDGPAPLDGTPRVGSYRRLEPYPLYALANIDRAVVLGTWRDRVLRIGAAMGLLGLLFGWLAHEALQRTRRELQTAEQLQTESDRRARAEASLVQAQRLEALGRLVGGVAHDFNNVLAVIASHALLLRRVAEAPARERSLAAVDRAVATGARLTQQLLTVTRRHPTRREVVDLRERLPAVAELLRPVFGPQVQVRVSVAADTQAVELDAGEFEVALINLAINARDAMPDGGRFELRARNASAAQGDEFGAGFVVVDAADTGAGMDAATAAQAFEPFFTTKPAGKGTGLGLSQVQALCAACQGAARIRSRPGEGTVVRLYLASTAAMPQADQPCVLLVHHPGRADDLLASALRAAGCDVLAVDDARMARAILAGTQPRVDFALVDADGQSPRELDAWLRRLRRQRDGLQLVLAASGTVGAELDADLVLRKPCSAALLQSAMAFAMRPAPDAVPAEG